MLGRRPNAGMNDIAEATGVVRRTVYGHFPTRADLIRAIAQTAASKLLDALHRSTAEPADPAEAWARYVTRIWPVIDRYRVLLELRRSEYGDEIHDLLAPVDTALADLVREGQASGAFTRHLPAETLGRIAQWIVFTLASEEHAAYGDDTAATTSLLVLGVPEQRARRIVHRAR
ncbi:TetR family transcriptional regulator [Amnibacterium kyonggiense]|uniref:TetR family transcriptional regulator n=1 Tax=Amnibacterium kyonggiense TaxID=595671 RepID=A0A4R7FR86_9MICO|nr:TetR family transcriptional regulator [Amnibacterium kyonggiense]